MGNEMGNNNTSELREEEDNKSIESEGKSKEENNVVSIPEDIDCEGKDSGFAADDDDPKATMHTNGKEAEETEVHLTVASPESELHLAEESAINNEFQIKAPLSEESEDRRSLNSCDFEDNVSVMRKDQIEKEEEEMVNKSPVATALSEELEFEHSEEEESEQVEALQSKLEEPNIAINVADKSVAFELAFQEDSRPTNEQFGVEVENGDRIVDAEILKENDVQFSILEETKLIGKESRIGDSEHADGDSNSEDDASSNSSELRENPEKNGILQAEEMSSVSQQEIFTAKPSIGNGIHCECASSEGTIAMALEPVTEKISITNGESEEKEPVKEQILEIEANTEEPVLAEDQLPITVAEYLDDQIPDESKSEGKLESSTSEFLETAALHFDVKSTSVPVLELPFEKPDEAEAIQLGESESIEGRIALVWKIQCIEESEDNKFLEVRQTLEIPEKTEPPEFGEPFKPSLSAFLFHPEDQLQKIATYTEDTQVLKYLTSESKLKTGSEFLEAEALPINDAATSMEASVPEINQSVAKPEEVVAESVNTLEILTETDPSGSDNHSMESCNGSVAEISIRKNKEDEKTLGIKAEIAEAYKPEEAEAISVETPKILTETNPEHLSTKSCSGSIPEISQGETQKGEQTLGIKATTEAPEFTEEYKPSFSDSQFRLEDQQQKTAAKCGKTQVLSDSTSELKLESNGELLEAVFSSFYAITTSVLAIDQPIEKPEEAQTLEILTETNLSGSEIDSTKSCNGPNPDIWNEEQKETLVDKKLPGSAGDSKAQIEKVETLTPDNREQETTARSSIESNPDSYTAQPEMKKSPSFGPDLRIEAAKTKESDQTPLLYHSKSTNEQDVMNFQASLKLEKSDSEKSKSPFPPEPKQQDRLVSAKKNKHRRRSSLFTNCMCCTTVLN